MYDILSPSVTTSAPCFYCGETDLVRTTSDSDQAYPLCHHCRTVKKFGPVLRRKKRAIVPTTQKKKNKSNNTIGSDFIDFIESGCVDETEDSDEETREAVCQEDLSQDSDEEFDFLDVHVQVRSRGEALEEVDQEEDTTQLSDQEVEGDLGLENQTNDSDREIGDEVNMECEYSLPPTPTMYTPVDQLLDDSDED